MSRSPGAGLGACGVAGGDVPGQIYKELGDGARFPISGYRNDADWAGSAVIDFTYYLVMRDHVDADFKVLLETLAAGEIGVKVYAPDKVFSDDEDVGLQVILGQLHAIATDDANAPRTTQLAPLASPMSPRTPGVPRIRD